MRSVWHVTNSVIARDRHDAVHYLMSLMGSYDGEHYADEIDAGRTQRLVDLEWEHMWQPNGEDTFAAESTARSHADERGGYVIKITEDDVREAIVRAFLREGRGGEE